MQLTPPGSACSIALGTGLVNTPPGSAQGLQLVVPDIEAAHAELVERGVEVSEIQKFDWGSFVFFSDPDGNGWAVQQIRPATERRGLETRPRTCHDRAVVPPSRRSSTTANVPLPARPRLTFGLGLAVGIAVVGLLWLYLGRGDAAALEQDPGHPAARVRLSRQPTRPRLPGPDRGRPVLE